jgi:hypothetical protein
MKFYHKIILIVFLFFITIECSLTSANKRKKIKDQPPTNNNNNNNNNQTPKNAMCNTAQPLSNEVQKFIVDYHNKLRNEVASKTINWKSTVDLNNYFPYASNMMQMYWDNQLANQAQTYANLCKTKHSSFQERAENEFKSNESIFYRKYKNAAPQKPDFGTAISFWFDKINKFSVMKKDISSYNYLGVNIDSFAQIIWAENYKVGCGYSTFKNEKNNLVYELFVCLYGTGLKEKSPIYKSSSTKACKCPNTTSCGNPNYTSLCCPIGFCSKDILLYEGPSIFRRRK